MEIAGDSIPSNKVYCPCRDRAAHQGSGSFGPTKSTRTSGCCWGFGTGTISTGLAVICALTSASLSISASSFRDGAYAIRKGLGTGRIITDRCSVTDNPCWQSTIARPMSPAKSSGSTVSPSPDSISIDRGLSTWMNGHSFLAWSPLTRRGAIFAFSAAFSRSSADSPAIARSATFPAISAETWATPAAVAAFFADVSASFAFPSNKSTSDPFASLSCVSMWPATMLTCSSPPIPARTKMMLNISTRSQLIGGFSGNDTNPRVRDRRQSFLSSQYSWQTNITSNAQPTIRHAVQKWSRPCRASDCLLRLSISVFNADSSIEGFRADEEKTSRFQLIAIICIGVCGLMFVFAMWLLDRP